MKVNFVDITDSLTDEQIAHAKTVLDTIVSTLTTHPLGKVAVQVNLAYQDIYHDPFEDRMDDWLRHIPYRWLFNLIMRYGYGWTPGLCLPYRERYYACRMILDSGLASFVRLSPELIEDAGAQEAAHLILDDCRRSFNGYWKIALWKGDISEQEYQERIIES